jgi:hypothetical protein
VATSAPAVTPKAAAALSEEDIQKRLVEKKKAMIMAKYGLAK